MLGSYLARVADRDIETGRVLIQIELCLLDSQVNMLLDAEAEVAIVGEVLLPQLVLLHLEAPLQDFLGLQVTLVKTEKMSCKFHVDIS